MGTTRKGNVSSCSSSQVVESPLMQAATSATCETPDSLLTRRRSSRIFGSCLCERRFFSLMTPVKHDLVAKVGENDFHFF